ncbi:MAG: helix-turn-helix domain-containing protein [Christensenellaceae bacterium]|nr:helix-turn-helix domain-containing protein [Christensenellaceae bacterium]
MASDESLTISQTTYYLQISDKTVRRLIKNNLLIASKVGDRAWRIKLQDIENYLNAHANSKKLT